MNAHRTVVNLDSVKLAGLQVGTYVGRRKGLVETAIPCPYCQTPLKRAMPAERIGRVMRLGDRLSEWQQEVFVHLAPRGQRFYACYVCRVPFSLPREIR